MSEAGLGEIPTFRQHGEFVILDGRRMRGAATRLGDVLNDAYELLELLRSSEQLEVYLGSDKRTRAAVRVNVVRPEFALQGRVVDELLRTPRALAGVSHPSLPSLRADTDDTGIPFVVEEVIEGRNLSALIASFPQGMPAALVEQLAVPLVEGLALVHERGLAHGSIDADHVKLVGHVASPIPKWIGLAGSQSPQDASYRAPEPRAAAPHADVFALGVLLYAMLSGELPFRSGKRSAVPLDEIAPNQPMAWVELTRACLEADPERRLPDAIAVRARLRLCTDSKNLAQPLAEATRAFGQGKRKGNAKRDPRMDAPAAARSDRAAAPRVAAASPVATRLDTPGRAQASPLPAADTKPPKDKKLAAQEVAEKLSAKHRPAGTSPPRPRSSPLPPPAASPPLELAEARRSPRPAAAQAAIALTSVQLDALRALRRNDDEDERRDRWLPVLFMLLFVVILQLGVPLLREPGMVVARSHFGSSLRVVATAFTVIAVVGAVRAWIGQLGDRTLVHRLTSFVLLVAVGCIVLITLTLYSSSPALRAAAGLGGRALPWAVGFLFLLLALQYLLRGLQHVGHDLLYGAFVLVISGLCLYGTYRCGIAEMLADQKLIAASGKVPTPADLHRAFGKRGTAPSEESAGALQERHEIGASEAEDLKPIDQLEDSRRQQRQTLTELE